jgi:hypothetical protein
MLRLEMGSSLFAFCFLLFACFSFAFWYLTYIDLVMFLWESLGCWFLGSYSGVWYMAFICFHFFPSHLCFDQLMYDGP